MIKLGRLISDFLAKRPKSSSWVVRINNSIENGDTIHIKQISFKVIAKTVGKDGGYDIKIRPIEEAPEEEFTDANVQRS